MKAFFARGTIAMALPMGVAAVCAGLGATGCGASIQAVYEGDVRFEHCMALDAQPQVNASFCRACWVEWITFYTYGQTRDRVAHAQLRIEQLDAPGDLVKSNHRGDDDELARPMLGKTSAALTTNDGRLEACERECHRVNEDCAHACEAPGSSEECRAGCGAGLFQCERACQ